MSETRRTDAAGTGMIVSLWASAKPDDPAILSAHGDRTFAELNANANRSARALRCRGLAAGDGIALLSANRPEFAEVVAAAQRSGLRLTPINWHLTAEEAGYIVADSGAKAIVADARFAEMARGAVAAAGAPTAAVRLAVGGAIAGYESYDDALAPEDGSDIGDPVMGTTMLYTSGTTGRPKGVHRPPSSTGSNSALVESVAISGRLAAAGPSMHLCTGPLYHAAPLAFSLALPLAQGMGVVLMDGWGAEETLRLIERHQITHTHIVPTMFHRLLSLPEDVRKAHDTSSLRFVIHGAAPCPVAIKQAIIDWWGPVLYEYYAATEGSGTFVTSEDWLKKPGTVGKPPSPDHIRILDDDGDGDGRALPAGQVGTIYIKAPKGLEFSYYHDPAKTASAYRGEHFTLGDVGYLDEDGYLYLTDRSVNLIISGGVNIYPAEVEAVLFSHPSVGDVAVIGVPNTEWGEEVLAVVEPQPGVATSAELEAELIAWSRARLAAYKCPRRVDFTDQLPRQDNGKLYKQKLREDYRLSLSDSSSGRE
jgi:long-chain acyl-CoA synthetase